MWASVSQGDHVSVNTHVTVCLPRQEAGGLSCQVSLGAATRMENVLRAASVRSPHLCQANVGLLGQSQPVQTFAFSSRFAIAFRARHFLRLNKTCRPCAQSHTSISGLRFLRCWTHTLRKAVLPPLAAIVHGTITKSLWY